VSERRRIAYIGARFLPSRGGVSRVVEDLLVRLRDRYELTVYCEAHEDAATAVAGVEVIQLPRVGFGSLGVLIHYALCCLDLLWRGRHDLVHVHKTDAAPFLPLLTRRFHCVATSHEAPYRRDKWSWIGRFYFRLAERIFMRSRATLTCISRALCEEYVERWQRCVEYVPNGVDGESAIDRDGAARVLAEAGVTGPFVLFAARRVMATKGAHTLLEAIARLAEPPTVVVLGDLDHLPAYTHRLRALARGSDVHFFGYVADKPLLLGMVDAAELFVFPSETEGMSIMLLEAARVGTPIVASSIPENRAVFDDAEVLFFQVGDASALAKRIAEARRDPAAMRARAERARERVLHQYAGAQVAERYAEIYERVLVPRELPGSSPSSAVSRRSRLLHGTRHT
jgi:glycosyltransferase involved in cell wall biosynthesis